MRLADRGVASYREICEYWDIDEVYDALEYYDIKDDVEAQEAERVRRAAGK